MKKIVLLFFLLLLSSCFKKSSCIEDAEYSKSTECLLIVEELPVFSSPYLNVKGKHLTTNKQCECEDNSRWWSQYRKYIEKGDTIIKRKGKLIFEIHKKDTILSFNWQCEGKIYK